MIRCSLYEKDYYGSIYDALASSFKQFFVSATAVSDPTGDVVHWSVTGTSWGWEYNVGSKLEIDITEISYTVNGDNLTITLQVADEIQPSNVI